MELHPSRQTSSHQISDPHLTLAFIASVVAVAPLLAVMFKSAVILLLAQSTAGFAPPSTLVPPAPFAGSCGPLHNSLRDLSSYGDELKYMENISGFDRNGAFSGNRGYNNAYNYKVGAHGGGAMGGYGRGVYNREYGGGYGGYDNYRGEGGYQGYGNNRYGNGERSYYGSDGSYYVSNRNNFGRNNYRGRDYYANNLENRRSREISFSGSRGYNGPYAANGRGYDGSERYGRSQYGSQQRVNSYQGYNSGRRALPYQGGTDNAYSGRSQYDFRRGGDYARAGYNYADSMDDYRYRQQASSRPREDRTRGGFAYSSRVREYDVSPYYDERMMGGGRMDGMMDGMGYNKGYDDYDWDYGYGSDSKRRGYGYEMGAY